MPFGYFGEVKFCAKSPKEVNSEKLLMLYCSAKLSGQIAQGFSCLCRRLGNMKGLFKFEEFKNATKGIIITNDSRRNQHATYC